MLFYFNFDSFLILRAGGVKKKEREREKTSLPPSLPLFRRRLLRRRHPPPRSLLPRRSRGRTPAAAAPSSPKRGGACRRSRRRPSSSPPPLCSSSSAALPSSSAASPSSSAAAFAASPPPLPAPSKRHTAAPSACAGSVPISRPYTRGGWWRWTWFLRSFCFGLGFEKNGQDKFSFFPRVFFLSVFGFRSFPSSFSPHLEPLPLEHHPGSDRRLPVLEQPLERRELVVRGRRREGREEDRCARRRGRSFLPRNNPTRSFCEQRPGRRLHQVTLARVGESCRRETRAQVDGSKDRVLDRSPAKGENGFEWASEKKKRPRRSLLFSSFFRRRERTSQQLLACHAKDGGDATAPLLPPQRLCFHSPPRRHRRHSLLCRTPLLSNTPGSSDDDGKCGARTSLHLFSSSVDLYFFFFFALCSIGQGLPEPHVRPGSLQQARGKAQLALRP